MCGRCLVTANQASARAQTFSLDYARLSQAIHQDMSLKSTDGKSVSFGSLSSIEKKVNASLPGHSKADQSLCNKEDDDTLERFLKLSNQIMAQGSSGVHITAEEWAFLETIPNCGLYGVILGMMPMSISIQMVQALPQVSSVSSIDQGGADYLDLETNQDQHFRFRLSGQLKKEMTLAELVKVRSLPG